MRKSIGRNQIHLIWLNHTSVKKSVHIILFGLFCLILVDILQLGIPRIIKWTVDDLTSLKIGYGRFVAILLIHH